MSPPHTPFSQKRFRIESWRQAIHPTEKARSPSRPIEERRPRATSQQAPLSTSDLVRLQAELSAMKDAIATTKREVASVQRSAAGRDGMHRAACELDAVFDSTERATTTILGAAEEIESAANMLRASGLESGRNDFVGTILDRVVLLYETCNFQDITGQRIEKVVGTLKFVEEHLDTMITTWSQMIVSEPWAPPPAEVGTGRDLAHGPGLPGDDSITQSDIDMFFG